MEITIFGSLLVSDGKMVLYGFSGFFARPLLEASFGVEENDPRVFVVCSQVGLRHLPSKGRIGQFNNPRRRINGKQEFKSTEGIHYEDQSVEEN
mmetsp:Transcript_29841/g.62780  ORF Transcript_29841/g.62780 Transcript_29841/m.62780 type:complete len:94 (+) Transcript_29841:2149-2430(+)